MGKISKVLQVKWRSLENVAALLKVVIYTVTNQMTLNITNNSTGLSEVVPDGICILGASVQWRWWKERNDLSFLFPGGRNSIISDFQVFGRDCLGNKAHDQSRERIAKSTWFKMYTIYSILKHYQILWHYAAIEDIQFCEKLGKTFFYLFFFFKSRPH